MKLVSLYAINSLREAAPGNEGQPASSEPDYGSGPASPSGAPPAQQGTRITGDAATLGALENILSDVTDESVMDWADEARDALGAAIRKGGDQITATLPPFKQGGSEDEGDME